MRTNGQRITGWICAGLVGAGLSWNVVVGAADTGTLMVRVKLLASHKGQVRVAVYKTAEEWLKTPAYSTLLEAGEGAIEWRTPAMPYGIYAVAIYQDENRNGEHDHNALGVPKEPYGFSNNARGRFGPAKFKDAQFTLAAPTMELEINVK